MSLELLSCASVTLKKKVFSEGAFLTMHLLQCNIHIQAILFKEFNLCEFPVAFPVHPLH